MSGLKKFINKKAAAPPADPPKKKKPKPKAKGEGYARLCVRALEVGLREAKARDMTDGQIVLFLTALETEISAMRHKRDFADPFVDRAVQGALKRVEREQELEELRRST